MAKELNLSKRSQVERITLVSALTETIWTEFLKGEIDDDIILPAVNAQVILNRIVWCLIERKNAREEVQS